MDKKERFCKAYEYLRSTGKYHTQEELADIMGASRSNVSSALKGKTSVLTDKFLQRFSMSFPGVFNLEWLLTGEGNMLQAQHLPQEPMKDVQPISASNDVQKWLMRQNEELIELLKRANATIERKEHEIAKLRAELNQGSATYGEALVADGVTPYGEQKKF